MSIAKNIKEIRERFNLTQAQLGEIAGVSDKAVSTWENGTAEPRLGAIQKIATALNIKKSDIVDDADGDGSMYYLDPDAAEIAQEVQQRPELKILFDASRKVSANDLELVINMIDRLKKNEGK